jgi:hypothetical protein
VADQGRFERDDRQAFAMAAATSGAMMSRSDTDARTCGTGMPEA